MSSKKRVNPIRKIFGFFKSLFQIPAKLKAFFTEEQETNSLGDTIQVVVQHPEQTIPHFIALRYHLIRSVLYVVFWTGVSFFFSTQILEFLAQPLEGGLSALQAIDVTETVGTVMRVSLLCGFTVSVPFIAFEIWFFFAPGLYGHERLSTLMAIPFAAIFFVLGMAFAFYYMLPVALPVLIGFVAEIKTLVRPNSYFPFVVNMLFWIGLFSEFPLIIFLLARMGFVKAKHLIAQWRLAVVIMAVIAAIITPTTDIANMVLTMAPMFILYTLSIILAFIAQRDRQKPKKA